MKKVQNQSQLGHNLSLNCQFQTQLNEHQRVGIATIAWDKLSEQITHTLRHHLKCCVMNKLAGQDYESK